jgi:phosphatidylglycerol---prolipoprotein diacylglyceryl transferase
MYPTIYHALFDLFGLDWSWTKLLNSFGFFVALAFICASYTLTMELRRRAANGTFEPQIIKTIKGSAPNYFDVFFNAFIGFILGWKFIYLIMNSDRLFGSTSPQQHIFSNEGNWMLGLVLMLAFGAWRWWEYRRDQLPQPVEVSERVFPHHLSGSITFMAAIFGIAGAKLFHLIENPDEFKEFFTAPSVNSFLSGLTVYGGLIVGAIGVLIFAHFKKIPLLHLCDAAAPGLILAYGVGRIGCQVSGDGDWGIVNTAPKPGWLSWAPDWLWSYDYPHNVNVVGQPLFERCAPQWGEHCTHLVPGVYPTPVYETTAAILIFIFLWRMRQRWTIPGTMFGVYLILNGIERFLIEKIRVNNVFDWFGIKMTQAELISVMFILAGIGLLFYVNSRKSTAQKASTVS